MEPDSRKSTTTLQRVERAITGSPVAEAVLNVFKAVL